MKVVLFCGGLGMRIRDFSDTIPKPMVPIGYRPILWHVMKYYAFHGHRDFILCLGYRGDTIKRYFLDYNECESNDFVLSDGGKRVELLGKDIEDWTITFVNTGLEANLGQRLSAVRHLVEQEPIFLANYSDGLTDLKLADQLAHFEASGATASFVSVRPTLSYHFVDADVDGRVRSIHDADHHGMRINGGYFAFRPEIFQSMRSGEELVGEPFRRLIADGKLVAWRHDGFWTSMDTFKDRQRLQELYDRGRAPWEVWNGR